MKAVRGRFACLMSLASAFAVGIGGCTIGGKSLYIDSNSRVPFFGLELKERQRKASGPSYNSIRRSDADPSRVETAVGGSSSTSVNLLKKGDKRLASVKVDKSSDPGSVSQKVPKSKSVQSIPLPRTDDDPGSPDRRVATSVIDFE